MFPFGALNFFHLPLRTLDFETQRRNWRAPALHVPRTETERTHAYGLDVGAAYVAMRLGFFALAVAITAAFLSVLKSALLTTRSSRPFLRLRSGSCPPPRGLELEVGSRSAEQGVGCSRSSEPQCPLWNLNVVFHTAGS